MLNHLALAVPTGNLNYTANPFALTVRPQSRESHGHYFATTTTIFPFALPVFNFVNALGASSY